MNRWTQYRRYPKANHKRLFSFFLDPPVHIECDEWASFLREN
jgi:hypothetical protein